MRNKQGEYQPDKKRKDGKPLMVGRIVFLEPALWNMYDRFAKSNKITRSTFIRRELKDHRRLEKMSGVDWLESNIKPG